MVVQQQRRQHSQEQLEEGRDERVDERVLEGAQEDRVVQVHPEVVEADEGAGPSDHLVADRQPDAEDERVGDEEGQDHEGGREEHTRQDVLALEEAAEPARAADRKSTRLNSSHTVISYAVFCLKKKKKKKKKKRHKQKKHNHK